MNHSALLDHANKAISKPLSQTIIASSLMIASTFLRIGGPVPQTLQTLALAWICLQFSPRIAYVATFAAILAFPVPRLSSLVFLGFLAAIPIWHHAKSQSSQQSLMWLFAGLIPIFSIVYFLCDTYSFIYLLTFDVIKMLSLWLWNQTTSKAS